MATEKKGQCTLRGRFRAGSIVQLFEVTEEQLRPHEDAEALAVATVDGDGVLKFEDGVKVGGRYIAAGYVDGFPLNVRLRGRAEDHAETDVQGQITQDEVRTRDGRVFPDRGQPLLPSQSRAPHDAAKLEAIAITEKREAAAKKRKAAPKKSAPAKKSTTAKKPAAKSAAKGAK